MKIIEMNKKELLALNPNSDIILSTDDLLYIFDIFQGFWSYDYEAAKAGKIGIHAELKSKMCSDGFFYSKIVLQHKNLRQIIAKNMVRIYDQNSLITPTHVAGIPKGATELGNDIAEIMHAKKVLLFKDDNGNIRVDDSVNFLPTDWLLLVEDFCSTGSGFAETVMEIKKTYFNLNIMPIELVILNRGGIEYIPVGKHGFFDIMPLVTHKINSWEPSECPICKMGSERIKPKATNKNWERLTTSQK